MSTVSFWKVHSLTIFWYSTSAWNSLVLSQAGDSMFMRVSPLASSTLPGVKLGVPGVPGGPPRFSGVKLNAMPAGHMMQ
jgi:hypothetical protein